MRECFFGTGIRNPARTLVGARIARPLLSLPRRGRETAKRWKESPLPLASRRKTPSVSLRLPPPSRGRQGFDTANSPPNPFTPPYVMPCRDRRPRLSVYGRAMRAPTRQRRRSQQKNPAARRVSHKDDWIFLVWVNPVKAKSDTQKTKRYADEFPKICRCISLI